MQVPNTQENMNKCICGQCDIFKQYKLGNGYFCLTGKA
ncbi:MAG: DUF2769 domain-containing protein [bacterium]|nr:DUF2769 domain-containing protein [bacterium]MDD5354904.1 DUF2769 domain-containing protein [bacterium]MDD5756080.1 DUF2769 domain-containing protein [bacterium]